MFKSMRAAGMKPSAITYSSLITARANGGNTEEALDVFKSMQAAGLKPEVITYSSLIAACANGGKTEETLLSPCKWL